MGFLGPRRALLAPPLDVDALKWRAAVLAAGGQVSGAQIRRVSKLIRSLKAGNVWNSLDRCWVFAAENSVQALIDLKNRSVATVVNSPVFTAMGGYAGNGSNGYVNTGFNTLSSGVQSTQSSGHFSVWQNTPNSIATPTHGNINTDAGTNGTFVDFSPGASAANARINSTGGPACTVTGGIGQIIANRTGASVTNTWYNGTKTNSGVQTSQTPQNLTLWIGARNFAGGVNQANTGQVPFVTIGGGLTDSQAVAMYAALLAYKTAVGA